MDPQIKYAWVIFAKKNGKPERFTSNDYPNHSFAQSGMEVYKDVLKDQGWQIVSDHCDIQEEIEKLKS